MKPAQERFEKAKKYSDNLSRRFWEKVAEGPIPPHAKELGPCSIWTGCRNGHGYGQLFVNGRIHRAHRVSWSIQIGEIPKGLCVLHKCDNPPCVRIEHLFIGTRSDNGKDMCAKGRGADYRGEKNPSSVLSDEDRSYIAKHRVKGRAYRPGNISILAKRFGVSEDAILRVPSSYASNNLGAEEERWPSCHECGLKHDPSHHTRLKPEPKCGECDDTGYVRRLNGTVEIPCPACSGGKP